MPISATGLATGLDVESLVTQLVGAEVAPAANRLLIREAQYQAEISAYGALKGALSSFQSSLASAADFATFQAKSASSSLSTKVSVSATAAAANASYQVEVTSLAEAKSSVLNSTFSSSSASLGSGTVSITVDGTTTNVLIDSSNDSLAAVAEAISNSSAGVKADVIYDGTNYRLALQSSTSGTANAFSIAVTDDDLNNTDGNGLSQLVDSNTTETNAAVNASIKINGLALSSATNEFSEAIDGVTFTAVAVTDAGEYSTVTISDNTSGYTSAVGSLVNGYNQFIQTVNEVSSYDPETGASSALAGDSTVRNVASQIRNLMNSEVDNGFSTVSRLAELGITTNVADGTLSLDTTILDAKISSDRMGVAAALAPFAIFSDSRLVFDASTTATKEGAYAVSGTDNSTSGAITASGAITNFNYAGSKLASFDVSVDGGAAQTITLNSNLSDSTGLLAAINGQLTGATASVDGSDVLSITSDQTGSSSTVSISNADANATSGLLIANGSGTTGTASFAYSIAGQSATYDATNNSILGAEGSDVEGLSIEFAGNPTGNLGSVIFSKGIAAQLDDLLTSLLADDGIIDSRVDGLNSSISDIADANVQLEYRAELLEKRYREQFNGLETLISGLTTTQSFLTQALSGLVDPNTTLK